MSIRIVHDERFAQAFKELESDKDFQKELESIEREERRLRTSDGGRGVEQEGGER